MYTRNRRIQDHNIYFHFHLAYSLLPPSFTPLLKKKQSNIQKHRFVHLRKAHENRSPLSLLAFATWPRRPSGPSGLRRAAFLRRDETSDGGTGMNVLICCIYICGWETLFYAVFGCLIGMLSSAFTEKSLILRCFIFRLRVQDFGVWNVFTFEFQPQDSGLKSVVLHESKDQPSAQFASVLNMTNDATISTTEGYLLDSLRKLWPGAWETLKQMVVG